MAATNHKPSTGGRSILGFVLILAATLLWSGNFVIARGVVDDIPPVRLAFFRWLVASLALAPIGLPHVVREWKAVRRCLPYLAATGFFGVTLFNTFLYIGSHHTTTLNLALISTFIPVFIIILSWLFLKEPATSATWTGLVVAVFGVVLLITRGDLEILASLSFNVGDLWMLLASLLFAVYTLLVRRKPPDLGPTAFLTAIFILGLAMLAPWAAFEWSGSDPVAITPKIVGAVLYIGIGASLAAFYCWNRGVSIIGPSNSGLIYYSLPLFSGLEANFFLGEPITWVHLASGALIIGGIAWATRR